MFSDNDIDSVRQFYEAHISRIPMGDRRSRILKVGINYPAIQRRINLIIEDYLSKNYTPLDTANELIHKLLNLCFFEYDNHIFSLYIGYIYLKSMGIAHNTFTIDAITQVSSIANINSLTITW
ncbi:MAG: hypothetical protein LBV68_08250 [Spirochaetaceae bacterium]|jgi:hypothetical protein|nr:hypothetical protein [Spirochaetaceae bacterium]